MKIQIYNPERESNPLKMLKNGTLLMVASEPYGLSPAGCYMLELGIQLNEEQSTAWDQSLRVNRETVSMYPKNLCVVPMHLKIDNIIDCFIANEKYHKQNVIYFDLESNGNDLYQIVDEATRNFQFNITKEIFIDSRDILEKWKK